MHKHTIIMARKDAERAKARRMFVELGITQKEIAEILDVRENTVGEWAKAENWRAARTARMTTNETVLENGKMAIANLSDIMLDLQRQRAEAVSKNDKSLIAICDGSILSTADAIAKTGGTVNRFEKNNAITLVTYLNVMDTIFKALQTEDPKLYHATLDFQERHVRETAKKIG